MSVFQLFQPNKPVLWSDLQKALLRFFILFFGLLIIPLDWKYYRDIFSLDWSGLNYGIWFEASKYFPRLLSNEPELGDLANLVLLSLLGTWIWSKFHLRQLEENKAYYWLRTVVRYRLAIALLAYGFIKLFPIQAPYPSITMLNTPYGDFSAWKIFHLSLGIVPDYQGFLGGFEILAALLLFNRKTASIGAFIALLIVGNVMMSNLAYEGGEFVYSATLSALAFFVFAHDLPRFFTLLFLRKKTLPDRYRIVYGSSLLRKGAPFIKAAIIFSWVVLYGFTVYVGYSNGINKYPERAGVPDTAGVYDVELFIYEGDTLPYGLSNPNRWEKVVFEEWNTLSIQSERPVNVVDYGVEYVAVKEDERKFEVEGIKGWHFYQYNWNEPVDQLLLHNRNPNHVEERLEFNFKTTESGQLEIRGKDADGKEFHAILSKLDKKYLLEEAAEQGRRGRIIL